MASPAQAGDQIISFWQVSDETVRDPAVAGLHQRGARQVATMPEVSAAVVSEWGGAGVQDQPGTTVSADAVVDLTSRPTPWPKRTITRNHQRGRGGARTGLDVELGGQANRVDRAAPLVVAARPRCGCVVWSISCSAGARHAAARGHGDRRGRRRARRRSCR